jgi:uncharacterized protein (TIGR03382 family)
MRWLLVVGVVCLATHVASADPDVSFGSVPGGQSEVRYMNVDSGTFGTAALVGGAISNDPNGWFTFATAGICDFTAQCGQTFSLAPVSTLIPFRCSPPAGATGTVVARVNFQGSTVQPTLSCTASTGLLAATPANGVLDFGAVDLRRVPVAQTSSFTIKNVGNASVTVSGSLEAGATLFTTSSLAAMTLEPGDHWTVTATYTPIAENAANSPDHAAVTFTTTGPIFSTLVMLLNGHGVDRHASLVASTIVAPDTFLKSGPLASVVGVTIQNSGGAILGVSDPQVTGSPVWDLVSAQPSDVTAFGSVTYNIAFTPSSVGPATPATFTVKTSDPQNPLLAATVSGSGIARNVTMGPATIDMQYVAIGTTARVSDGARGEMLVLTNNDQTTTFTVSSLFIGDNAFDVGDVRGTKLAPGSTTMLDVAFTPDHVGTYDTTATLRLDYDPDPAATIALHGEGLFVAAEGSGCSAGGDASIVVVVVALLLLRRRRWLVGLVAASTAHADTRNLDLSIFDPTPSTNATWFQMQSAEVGDEGEWSASGLVSYENQPLVLHTTQNDNIAIDNRTMFELGGAFAFGDRFEAALRFPLYLQTGENLNSAAMFGEPSASGTSAGNLAFSAKARVFRHHSPSGDLAVATAVTLELPTESSEQFAGSGKPQLDVLALVSFDPIARVSFTAQAGAVFRATATYHDVDQGNGVLWGVAASYRALPELAIEAELFGELVPSGLDGKVLDAIEALVGARYQIERRFNVGAAIGRGLTSAPGTPDIHGILAVTFSPGAGKTYGIAKHHVSGDADHDGIPDDVDKCPNQPEDKDGFQDEDGCPDPDNDNDGIPDAQDKCPNVPEDKDGFEDADGCPDPDNDHDGIPDRFDRCPNEPETINGIDDDDGCPDQGVGLVSIDKDVIKVGETVALTPGGRVDPSSFNVLGQLGATLRAHTELIKIRVKGENARVVVDWLVQYGVAKERLEATTAPGELEFTIVDRY